MKFSNFYYEDFKKECSDSLEGCYLIHESEYDRLSNLFQKDYKYFIECEEYKNDWGYGFKFESRFGNIILLNRWKDEIVNEDSKIICDNVKIFEDINKLFNINLITESKKE